MSFAAFVRAARQNSGKLGDASPACLESVNFAAYVNSVVKYKALLAEYQKGEISVAQAASRVGFRLPFDYPAEDETKARSSGANDNNGSSSSSGKDDGNVAKPQ